MNESKLDATQAEYLQILTALFRNHPVVAMVKISQKKTRFALSFQLGGKTNQVTSTHQGR